MRNLRRGSIVGLLIAFGWSGQLHADQPAGTPAAPVDAAVGTAGEQQSQFRTPHCDKPLATIAVQDGDDPSGWTQFSLAAPSVLIKALIQRSGCFSLIDRDAGLYPARHERPSAGDGGHMGPHGDRDRIMAPEYVLVAELQRAAAGSGGTSAAGGLLGRQLGALLGGVHARRTEANTVLSLTKVSTTETIATADGYATRSNLYSRASDVSEVTRAVGRGYDTDIGRIQALAYADAYRKLVEQARAEAAAADAPFLPWPPPSPSGASDVSRAFRRSADLGGLDEQIRSRLARRGYEHLHHFSVPGGFGVTTDVERIRTDGTPAADRWRVGKAPATGGMVQYITGLVSGEDGRFRLFAFLVTDQDPVPADYKATQLDIDRWKASGRLALSRRMSALRVQPDTKVWLLVYEFELSKSKGGKLVAPDQDGLPYSRHIAFLGLR